MPTPKTKIFRPHPFKDGFEFVAHLTGERVTLTNFSDGGAQGFIGSDGQEWVAFEGELVDK